MKYSTLVQLYKFCLENNILFDLINLEDTEFFERYEAGIPIYNLDKKIYNSYAIVHLDGPHHLKDIIRELEFFSSRMSLGGYIVLDDVTYFDINPIDEYLKENNFIRIENDRQKASYKKI